MRRSVVLVVLVVLAALAQPLHSQSAVNDRVAGWRSDLAFWLDQVRQQHYVYKSKPLPPALLRAAEDLSNNVPRYSDDRVLFEMQKLAAYVGDGHTYVLPLGARRVPGRVIPIRFYLFSDGLHVLDAQPGHEKWIGSRLIAIGRTPVSTILERMKTAISADNPLAYKWIGPPFLNLRGAIEAMASGVDGDSIPVTLQARSGETHTVKFVTVPPPRMNGVPKLMPSRLSKVAVPFWLRHVDRNFWMETIEPGVLYVQFNQVMDEPSRTLKKAGAELDSVLKDRRVAKVILDVRHNNGGNSYLYPPIIDALTRWETAVPSGKLYVLMGRNTFSAAQNFIAQLDKRTRAIFAGEPSSSSPNFVGEENNLQLPWSGAFVSISNRYHENIPGDKRQWIEPAINLVLSSADYFANRDPLLERILKLPSR